MKGIAAILLILFTGIGVGVLYERQNNPQIQIVEAESENIRYQIILECQKLSAIQLNPDWGYQSCIEELEKSLNDNDVIPASFQTIGQVS